MHPLSVLLEDLIDYAGLFPPASLPMNEAVARYARYREEPYAEALGRFVLPVSRLREWEAAASMSARIWRLSVLSNALPADLEQITAFHFRAHGRAVVDTLELKASEPEEVRALASQAPEGMFVYVELPLSDRLPELIGAVKNSGLRAKVRSGGLVPDAIPASHQIARFLAECARQSCAFKATAGLHHPVRCHRALTYESGSPQSWMHGFLNVFLAAALSRRGAPEHELTELLEDSQPGSFWKDDAHIGWRHHRFSTDDLSSVRREFAIAFGSCSFEEPINDLREMGWL